MAIYHPWNCYLVRLDLESERRDFVDFLYEDKVLNDFDSVRLLEGVGPVSSKGPTEVAVLGIAILLREFKDWNWFINLSASDYPLLPQDGTCPLLALIMSVIYFSTIIGLVTCCLWLRYIVCVQT
jgi:beta-glucuronosyltransferase